jgi:oligoribonuclease NrnB/cAMP/cGMP phosphodiesterase (DHH superfamily)
MAVLTQELLLRADRCMRHEDVVKKFLLEGLNHTLDEWLCESFVELIEEMELWKWDDASGDFWSRLTNALQQSNISVTWAEHLDSRLASVHATGKMSWAAAT